MNLPTLNKSFDASGAQFAWDSTSLKLAEECPRKYQYKMIEGWYNPGKNFHLLFGGWYAKALEHFYKYIALGQTREEALEQVVLEALVSTWQDGAPWLSPDTAKTRENLIRTIVWYVDHFDEGVISVIKLPDGRPAVEYSFTIDVDDGIQFSGHIDRLVEFSNSPYVMDQKTTGSTITQNYFRQFSPDIQMSMYTFAGKIIYNMPVKGVIIDGAQIAVGFTRFERGFTFRTESQLNEWYDETMQLIETTRNFTKRGHFPMRTSSCGNYGGCEFRSICSRSPQVRPEFLRAEFQQGPSWDPLDRR